MRLCKVLSRGAVSIFCIRPQNEQLITLAGEPFLVTSPAAVAHIMYGQYTSCTSIRKCHSLSPQLSSLRLLPCLPFDCLYRQDALPTDVQRRAWPDERQKHSSVNQSATKQISRRRFTFDRYTCGIVTHEPLSLLYPTRVPDDKVIQSLISVERDETRKAFLNGISQYRKLNKTKTTYMARYLEAAEEVRAHPLDPPSHYAIFCRSETRTQHCHQWTISKPPPPPPPPLVSPACSYFTTLCAAVLLLLSWNQTHTCTGRLSTSLPNLQSLPRGTQTVEEEEEDDEEELDDEHAELDADTDVRRGTKTVLREINIRDCFRAESNDSLLLSADFNQMEMRVMAHLADDRHLVHFFNSKQGSDIYVFMASLCFDCDEGDVTKEQRACAKQLTLGILYGMGAANMAKRLTRFTGRTYSDSEAGRLISKWKEKVQHYPCSSALISSADGLLTVMGCLCLFIV